MKVGIAIVLCSLVYMLLISVIYFSKKKVKTFENRVYKRLISITALSLITEFFCFFGVVYRKTNYLTEIFNIFICKLFLVLLFLWLLVFTSYIVYISLINKSKYQDKLKNNTTKISAFLLGLCILVIPTIIMLPLYYHSGEYVYSYGPASDVVLVFGVITIIIDIIVALINRKELSSKKYIPLLVLIVMMIFAAVIRTINPGLNIITASFTFIVIIMYFTMENPDMQMVDLLAKNNELVEKTVNERSNLLFKLSQELRKPVKDILRYIKEYKETKNKEDKEYLIEKIESSANNAYFTINDVSDISSMDVQKFNIQETTYGTKLFFKDIISTINNQISLSNKNINFSYKISPSCPDSLNGDKIKLKQIIISIVNNAIKHTNEGFIDLEVEAITRYDACRLIFTISDSGTGMPLNRVNKLLSYSDSADVNENNYPDKDDLNLKIPVISKLLNLQNGSINIQSKEGKGTIVTLVINQEINYDSTGLVLKEANKYSDYINKSKKVILAGSGKHFEKIKRILNKKDFEVVHTIIGKDVIESIKHGNKYDLIILEDSLEPDSAYSILKELEKIDKFSMSVIIAINENKISIKKKLIEEGFTDILELNNLEDEIKRISEKYL